MCTLTIHHDANGLLVTMNRDEVRTRAAERPPQRRAGGVENIEWLAPIDGESGGTWIGTNNRGMHAALLNRYLPTDVPRAGDSSHRPSRGQIIVDIMAQSSESAALRWVDSVFDPVPYPSFLLVVMTSPHTHTIAWDGRELRREKHVGEWLFFTSSSWRSGEVTEYRRLEFEKWLRQGAPCSGSIPAFHLLAPAGLLEWAPLMQREHTATRSITQIEANDARGETEMRHWPREHLVSPWTPLSSLRMAHAGNLLR